MPQNALEYEPIRWTPFPKRIRDSPVGRASIYPSRLPPRKFCVCCHSIHFAISSQGFVSRGRKRDTASSGFSSLHDPNRRVRKHTALEKYFHQSARSSRVNVFISQRPFHKMFCASTGAETTTHDHKKTA